MRGADDGLRDLQRAVANHIKRRTPWTEYEYRTCRSRDEYICVRTRGALESDAKGLRRLAQTAAHLP